ARSGSCDRAQAHRPHLRARRALNRVRDRPETDPWARHLTYSAPSTCQAGRRTSARNCAGGSAQVRGHESCIPTRLRRHGGGSRAGGMVEKLSTIAVAAALGCGPSGGGDSHATLQLDPAASEQWILDGVPATATFTATLIQDDGTSRDVSADAQFAIDGT